jgi:hypothetical protein
MPQKHYNFGGDHKVGRCIHSDVKIHFEHESGAFSKPVVIWSADGKFEV